jgi:hypothetical protein
LKAKLVELDLAIGTEGWSRPTETSYRHSGCDITQGDLIAVAY